MDDLEAQQNLSALLAGLPGLLPFLGSEACGTALSVLVETLDEALTNEGVSARREAELKQLQPRDLLARLSVGRGNSARKGAGDGSKRARKPAEEDDEDEDDEAKKSARRKDNAAAGGLAVEL